MLTDTEADDFSRRFREMETGGLVDAWEESLPDAVRALLQGELAGRGYRIKSLPEPPSPPAAGDPRAPAVQPLTREAHAREQVEQGVSWILWVALLQIPGGVYSLWYVFTHPSGPGLGGSARLLLAALPLALGAVFLVIHRRARHAPRRGLLLALALYIGVHGLLALLDPGVLLQGVALKILVLMAFVAGLRSATELERLNPEKG